VPRESESVGLVDRHDGALDLVGEAAEIAPPLGMIDELAAHLGKQLAVVADLDLGQPVGVGGDEIGELQHELAAGRRRHLRPRPVAHRLRRRGDGAIDVACAALRDLRHAVPR